MDDKKDYIPRIREAVSAIKIRYNVSTQKEIVSTLGYSAASYLSDLISGKFQLTERFVTAMADTYKVNPDYIKFGEGSLWLDDYGKNGRILVGNHSQNGDRNVMNDTEYIKKLIDEVAELRKSYVRKDEENLLTIQKLLVQVEEMQKTIHQCHDQVQSLIDIVSNLTSKKMD
jgi:formylmethanofuran dehydrogenase subunit E